MRIIISDMTNANTSAATTEQARRLEAAIRHGEACKPRLDGERRLIERRSHDEIVAEVQHLRTTTHRVPRTPGHPPVAPQGGHDD
jgi:hypothetical protein